jgi:hypothetical protein
MSKPTELLHVLEPFGGEENLTLMCGVEEFVYVSDKAVEFNLPGLIVSCKTGWDGLFHKQIWGILIRKHLSKQTIHHSSCITDFRLVGRIFETYTNYRLWF